MKVVDKNAWDEFVRGCYNDFGCYIVVSFAKKWAELMEAEITAGKDIKDVAQETAYKADDDGVTGFQFSTAVIVLSNYWVHGEQLRQWYNNKHGYSGDGVVMPSMLCVNEE